MLDLIVVSITVFLGLKGIFNGFSKELFGLIGLVGGVFLASRLAHGVGETVNVFLGFENPKTIALIGFALTLALFWVGSLAAGSFLGTLLEKSGLAVYDKLLGFLFAAGKIFFSFAIIAYALSNVTFISKAMHKFTDNSLIYPILVAVGGTIVKIDPSILTKESDLNVTVGDEAMKAHLQGMKEQGDGRR
ncbi:MAG: CvpA family protein [Campylobacterales bacterium]